MELHYIYDLMGGRLYFVIQDLILYKKLKLLHVLKLVPLK